MNTQQYVWIAIVIVGIVGGIEIGYAVSNFHNSYGMHHHFFNQYGGQYHNSGYMMSDPNFRQQMYSSMFDSTQYREEMSQYLSEHPSAMEYWRNTMMNNPLHQQMMSGMMSGSGMGSMGGMSNQGAMGGMGSMGMNHNMTSGGMGMQSGGMGSMGGMSNQGSMGGMRTYNNNTTSGGMGGMSGMGTYKP